MIACEQQQPGPHTSEAVARQGTGRSARPGRARLRTPEELARPGKGPHGSEVGDRAGAGPAGPHGQGSCPMTDDLVAGLPPWAWPSTPTSTHTSPPDLHFSRCTLLTVPARQSAAVAPLDPRCAMRLRSGCKHRMPSRSWKARFMFQVVYQSYPSPQRHWLDASS